MTERHVVIPIDSRSTHFVSTERVSLEGAVAAMPRAEHTPSNVADLLDRARRQFVLAGADYDNFSDCLLTSFRAIEALLRMHYDVPSPRMTLGRLINLPEVRSDLDETEHGYLDKFVLTFRNKLTHAGEPIGFTPGMSEEILGGCHRFVAAFVEARYPRT